MVSALAILASCGGGSEGPVVVDAIVDFGAIADGHTDDEPAIQAALDHAASMGGGTVRLRAGTYGISRPLVLRSRVHLVGEGPGKSVLRSLERSLGKNMPDANVWAAVAMVAADSASVSALTVDLSVAGTHANGVAALPSGKFHEGQPSTNCEISDVEVIGGGNYHAYMIWNLRGRGIRIVHNVVDGRILSPVDSHQEGIESYGGKDVLVGWNEVRNIGNTALNFGSAGLPDTGVDGLTVVGNVVINSQRGLNIGSWIDPSGPQNVENVRIESNEFSDLWQTGIHVSVYPGTEVRNLRIVDNTLADVGTSDGANARGIHFQGSAASASLPSAADIIVEGNTVRGVRGRNAIGALINYFPDVSLVDNTISGIDHIGLQAFGSSRLIIDRNSISNTGWIGLGSYGPLSSILVRENLFENWGIGTLVAGVQVDGAVEGEVRNNTFRKEGASGSAVRVEAGAANVLVFGNSVAARELTAAPFVNVGANSNLGTFTALEGQAVVMLSNALVTDASAVTIRQVTGDPLSFDVEVGEGVLQVNFQAVPSGAEEFHYEIGPPETSSVGGS